MLAIFYICVLLLLASYLFLGKFLERTMKLDYSRPTPAILKNDGVDFVPLSTWRVYLIQLLNIAGLGPVFGPIMGALWGPKVFLWIILGVILGGGIHDFISGVMSLKHDGESLPDLIGRYLGPVARHASTIFILILCVLVGATFVRGSANLIVTLIPCDWAGGFLNGAVTNALCTQAGAQTGWMWLLMTLVFLYFSLATILPIDKIIGKIYPFMALALVVMVLGLTWSIITGKIPPVPLIMDTTHPNDLPAWPIIIITVSCGAISGFHATQSPIMARCLGSYRRAKSIFYGSMLAEAFIALVWAWVAINYYGGTEGLVAALGTNLQNTPHVVYSICHNLLGPFGGFLAVLGVIALPITTGDTALRAARLILADYFKLPQNKVSNRFLLAAPVFAATIMLFFLPFSVIWRYFGLANQMLGAVVLWSCACFLARLGNRWWLAALPATFMTAMTVTYLMVESRDHGCLGLDMRIGTAIGIGAGLLALAWFIRKLGQRGKDLPLPSSPVNPATTGTTSTQH